MFFVFRAKKSSRMIVIAVYNVFLPSCILLLLSFVYALMSYLFHTCISVHIIIVEVSLNNTVKVVGASLDLDLRVHKL